jgi:hypothetical protein
MNPIEAGKLVTVEIMPAPQANGQRDVKSAEHLSCVSCRTTGRGTPIPISRLVDQPDAATSVQNSSSGNSPSDLGNAMTTRTETEQDVSDLNLPRLGCGAIALCPHQVGREKAHCGVAVPLLAGWNNLDSWQALRESMAGTGMRGKRTDEESRHCPSLHIKHQLVTL